MLTRCKKGMIIVGKKEFLRRRDVKKTLLGKLETHWTTLQKNAAWCKWQDVISKSVNLPS